MSTQNPETTRFNILTPLPAAVQEHGTLRTESQARRNGAALDLGAQGYVWVGVNDALARTLAVRSTSVNRWYGCNLSECLGHVGAEAAVPRRTVNWDRVWGVVTALVVSAAGWAAVGIAVSHLLP